jgi:hypothetical protein
MTKIKTILLLLLALSMTSRLWAQQFTFDLSSTTTSQTFTATKGKTITLVVNSFLPKGSYTINQSRQVFLNPALTLPRQRDCCGRLRC